MSAQLKPNRSCSYLCINRGWGETIWLYNMAWNAIESAFRPIKLMELLSLPRSILAWFDEIIFFRLGPLLSSRRGFFYGFSTQSFRNPCYFLFWALFYWWILKLKKGFHLIWDGKNTDKTFHLELWISIGNQLPYLSAVNLYSVCLVLLGLSVIDANSQSSCWA